MPLPESLQDDSWTSITARRILPLLVAYAETYDDITYGQLEKETRRRGWSHKVMGLTFRTPAGKIGDALQETELKWKTTIPPINALIVNQVTRLPGHGINYYLKHYLNRKRKPQSLTKNQRSSIVDEVHKDIFNFRRWRELLKYYGLPDPPRLKKLKKFTQLKPRRYNWSEEHESPEHKALKKYVATHPASIGLPFSTHQGEEEYILPSADSIDVLFVSNGELVAVEVKAHISNTDDLYRGVFQCIKYRELLRAEQRANGVIPQATSLLVSERSLPYSVAKVARRLNVKSVIIPLAIRSKARQVT
jgi:hypothetical protein